MVIFIPRQRTYIQGKELCYALGLLFTSKFKSSAIVKRFEKHLMSNLGVKAVCVFPSSRLALLSSLKLIGINPEDEILLPVHTYKGFIRVFKKLGVKPIFVHIDKSLNLDVSAIRKNITKRTKAIIVPHHYGNPVDIKAIRRIVGPKIKIIEDCAQAFGATIHGRKVGTLGDIGLFSFSRGKHFNLVGGAAIVAKDTKLLSSLKKIHKSFSYSRLQFLKLLLLNFYLWIFSSTPLATITTYPFQLSSLLVSKNDITAKVIHSLFKQSAKKYRFNGIQAWLGLRRLKRIDLEIKKQNSNAQMYNVSLHECFKITLPQVLSGKSSSLYYPILVRNRDEVARSLLKKGIDTKRDFHNVLCDREERCNFPFAVEVSEQILHLPVHATLRKKELKYIIANIKEAVM